MKRLYFYAAVIVMAIVTACGGNSNSGNKAKENNSKAVLVDNSATIKIDRKLRDCITITSYKIESNVREKGIENINETSGKITFVVNRNNKELKIDSDDIQCKLLKVYIDRTIDSTHVYEKFIKVSCASMVREIVKMKPGSKAEVSVDFQVKANHRNTLEAQCLFDALTKKGCIDEIYLD